MDVAITEHVPLRSDRGPAHVYQGGRNILTSGICIVAPGSPPLVVSVGGEARVIHFDLFPAFTRGDGVVVGGPHDEFSIAPGESKIAPVGDASLTYTLDTFRPDITAPDAAGRWRPTSYILIWEVWRPAPGMHVPAAPPPDVVAAGDRMRDPSSLC